jgi:hypothetical protein
MFGGSPRHHAFETPYAYRSLYRQRLLHRPQSVGPSRKRIINLLQLLFLFNQYC